LIGGMSIDGLIATMTIVGSVNTDVVLSSAGSHPSVMGWRNHFDG